MPSGWRNSAVTANQSATPPIIDASAVARTYASHGWRAIQYELAIQTAVESTSSPLARRFIRARFLRFVASSDGGSGALNTDTGRTARSVTGFDRNRALRLGAAALDLDFRLRRWRHVRRRCGNRGKHREAKHLVHRLHEGEHLSLIHISE